MNKINKSFCVYCHTLISDGRKYIGITGRSPKKRWSYGNGYHGTYFGLAIKKYGWDAFKHEILFDGLTEEEARNKEIELIAFYKSNVRGVGFNMTSGGEGVNGYKFTEEDKIKMRLRNLGKKQSRDVIEKRIASIREYYETNPRPKMSKEHLKKMLEARKGKPLYNKGVPLSREAREHLRRVNLGKKHSEETKLKMRKSSPRKKRVSMYSLDGNYIISFDSAQDAMRYLGKKTSSMIAGCARGELKTAYNYKWKYYE